ncbi:hypothetical protein BH09PLA1_BH09PLA1_23460 [soil metagenome]
MNNSRGETRRAGFEFEYAGLSIEPSARIVQETFGGEIEPISTFAQRVQTPLGTFNVELDAAILKNKEYETPLRALGFDPAKNDVSWLETFLLDAASTVVPIEISAPPIPIDRLQPLEDLRRRLELAGAKGTRASFVYAFGMHINAEISDPRDPLVYRDHLRATILLFPWLREQCEVDLTRRMTPYINPFPPEYARLILAANYQPDVPGLIDDYLEHNPTRNRPLDLTPAFALLDRDRMVRAISEMHLVKPRPAFHFRLPNCMIDEPDWTLASEWNRWVVIEGLANDRAKLARMSWEYLQADRDAMRPILDSWPEQLNKHVKGLTA